MGRKVLGLEVTAKAVKIALVKNGFHPDLLYCGITDVPSGFGGASIDDSSDISSIVLAVKEVTTKNKAMRKGVDTLALCVSNPQTVVRPVSLPVLPQKELDAAVEFELSKSFPGVGKTHVISFKEYSRDKKQIFGIASFSPRKMLDVYCKLVAALNYKNSYIDVVANSEAKAYFAFSPSARTNGVTVLCDIGSTGTQFTIVKGKRVLHSRQIPYGDKPLREIICDRLGVKPAEYELFRTSDPKTLDISEDDLHSIFRAVYANIVEQLHQTIEFYNADPGGHPAVSAVSLIGGGSIFPNLNEFFSSNTDLPVTLFKPHNGVKADRIAFSRAFSAIGAAIRED